MSDDQNTAAVRDAGFPGWKCAIRSHPEVTGRKVCVLTSPDYNPATHEGRIITCIGKDEADAFARALKSAKGSVH